jgi:hypothetical protein
MKNEWGLTGEQGRKALPHRKQHMQRSGGNFLESVEIGALSRRRAEY